jgi:transketolase
MRNSFVKTLYEEACANENIVLITGDLGFQLFDDFAKNLPNQFINAGLTEQSMMSMAAGIASTGKRVFVYSIANFSTFRCLEQIRNDVCYMDNSVVVVSVGAGFSYGTLGYSHHATEDLAVMRSLPNMDVISPCDKFETEILTKMIARTSKPTYLRLGKAGEPLVHNTAPEILHGKFISLSKGSKGYIFFTGAVGFLAMEAKKKLETFNVNVEVLSVPFVSDLDEDYLRTINPDLPLVVLEEHSSRAGLGSAFLEKLNQIGIRSQVTQIAASQKEISLTGSQDYLRSQNGISVDEITKAFLG